MKEEQIHLFNIEGDRAIGRRRHRLSLPLDSLILLVVVGVLLLILAFSFGVEQGRRMALSKVSHATEQAVPKVQESSGVETKPMVEVSSAVREQAIAPQEQTDKDESQGLPQHEKSYIIQVASYKSVKKDVAVQEAKRLEEKGYPTVITQKGDYVVIFVGEFGSRTEAEESMRSLKPRYTDCFIKKL